MARRSRRSRKSARRNPSYGIALRKNFLPALPLIGIVGLVGAGYTAYKAYDAYQRLTKPAVLVGGAVGAIVGYKYGKTFWERAAYATAGTGIGLLIDGYLNPEAAE
jgi:xanthosine utilization system XapX-like protein